MYLYNIHTHTHMHRYARHLLRCVCYKNDIHRRDSLRHRRVCLRVVRARATVSGACGRDRHHRHSAAVAAKSTATAAAAVDADRDRPRTVLCQRLRRVSTARQSVTLRRPTNSCVAMPFRRFRLIGRLAACTCTTATS